MKKFQRALVRLSIVALLLGAARLASAACDLKIVTSGTGPCLGNGTPGTPNVGDSYGLRATVNITGTPSHPFRILFTMANHSYSVSNVTVGAGNGYSWYVNWPLDLDDAIPWSITLDPDGVSGDTNLSNNSTNGVFTPTPPATVTDLYDPQVWNAFETYTYNFSGDTLSSLYAVYGYPTTHGAQSAISDSPPPNADYIVTQPYGVPILQTSLFNVPATTYMGTNSFVVQLSRNRVNPTILRTNTWASLSGMSTNWTQWIMPDPRCQSTDPAITAFVQASLPADYLTSMTPYDAARTLHKAVMKALVYEEPPLVDGVETIDAVGCLQSGIADCGGYSALLVASLRNVGIPARCISGFRQGEEIPHVRTEFHLPGVDWIVADATDGFDNDPTGTYAYDFGNSSDGNTYVAADTGDIHVLPYNTFEFIQVPNLWVGPSDASLISYTNSYGLTATPSIALLAKPVVGGNVSGAGAYTAGASVTISAIPTNGWVFSSWTDGNTQASRTVTVPGGAGTNYIANFIQLTTTMSINVSGNLAFGDVTTGSTATATLTISNTGNTSLLVTNISYPAEYSGAFSGTILAGGSTNVTVTFAPPSVGMFSGAVTVNSDATSGTSTTSATGMGVGTAAATATITVEASPSDWGTVTGGGTYTIGSTQQVTATAYTSWVFGSWSDGGAQTHTIIVPAGGATYTATFVEPTQSTVATPTITPDGGDLADSVKVTLKCATAKAVIYYTIDGSAPTISSLKYKSAITLTNSATINAVAYAGTNGPSDTATASFDINTPSITTPAALPDATAGTEYSTTLAAVGGTAPYKWKLFGTKLPTGLKLASTGILSGKAKAASNGPVTFAVELTDAKKGIAKQSFTLTVN